MNQFISYISIAIFSIFIGSQITESMILVPYWKSLSSSDFYTYYKEFGPSIGKFYTVLTIIAAIIPIGYSMYYKSINSNALNYALISSFFAILFILCFYVYFKGTNAQFYQSSFDEVALKNELNTWAYWHWGRIIVECTSLLFFVLACNKNQ